MLALSHQCECVSTKITSITGERLSRNRRFKCELCIYGMGSEMNVRLIAKCILNFNYRENMTIFKFWWIFLFLEGGRFVVKLVTAKVIRQHVFFFTLSYFFEIKKMIVLVHKNHDKWSNVSPVQHFCSSFDHANLLSFFRGSNFYQKLDSLQIWALKTFCLKRWCFRL